jgi:hypothetical protein
MSYIYYKEVIDEEHRLYAKEISKAYKITSITGNPHPNLVGAVIKQYHEDKGICLDKTFYLTANGMSTVYSYAQYADAMFAFLEMIYRDKINQIELQGTVYKFKYLGPRP